MKKLKKTIQQYLDTDIDDDDDDDDDSNDDEQDRVFEFR